MTMLLSFARRGVIFVFLFFAAALVLWDTPSFAADSASLTADSMRYDPKTRKITASGGVHLVSKEGELFADRGTGFIDDNRFELEGNVRGHFKEQFAARPVDMTCASLSLATSSDKIARVVTASGGVKLKRGAETISAKKITLTLGTDNYKAEGGMTADMEDFFVDADTAERADMNFYALNVRRYEDRKRRMTVSASRVDGEMERNDITELIASGGVTADVTGADGARTRITGKRVIYSLTRGTIVLSGGASAAQGDRLLRAENIVYNVESGRAEALGERPSLTFVLPEK
jgi:lipopolysaccharide export system protein LptA